MHVKHVHSQIVGREFHFLKHLIQSQFLTFFVQTNDFITAVPNFLLDESQQMLLIHTRRCVNMGIHLTRQITRTQMNLIHRDSVKQKKTCSYFTDIVEISMRNALL